MPLLRHADTLIFFADDAAAVMLICYYADIDAAIDYVFIIDISLFYYRFSLRYFRH